MNRIEINVQTGEQVVVPLTPEEIAEIQSRPAEPKPDITVSPRQLRQALNRAHLRAPVEAAVTAGDQDLKDWWEFATEFKRHHPMVLGMAASLGVSEEALDELFSLAATL